MKSLSSDVNNNTQLWATTQWTLMFRHFDIFEISFVCLYFLFVFHILLFFLDLFIPCFWSSLLCFSSIHFSLSLPLSFASRPITYEHRVRFEMNSNSRTVETRDTLEQEQRELKLKWTKKTKVLSSSSNSRADLGLDEGRSWMEEKKLRDVGTVRFHSTSSLCLQISPVSTSGDWQKTRKKKLSVRQLKLQLIIRRRRVSYRKKAKKKKMLHFDSSKQKLIREIFLPGIFV